MDGIDLVKEQCKIYKFLEKSRDQVDKIIDQFHLSKCVPVRA